jgi:hypothetical protein
MTQFYVNLPSNASLKVYPNNTLANYTTRLPNIIELLGRWEVALVELVYPKTWYNIMKGECSIEVTDNTLKPFKFTMLEGHYESIVEVVDVLNDVMQATAGFEMEMSVEKRTGKIVLNVAQFTQVTMNQLLAEMLGFEQLTFDGGRLYVSDAAANVNRGCSTLFVYCDVAEDVIVGDMMAPLLRTVNGDGRYGDTVHKIYTAPLYVPVQKSHFDTIEINIRSDTGQLVPFTFGRTIATLHFRRTYSLPI